jgi:type IV pilus assembly protein PilP
LEKLELSQVKLVAVVEMKNRTIAMVEEATGKGYEVAIGTYIGPNGGRVVAITQDGIKIEENIKDFQGKERKRYEEIKFHKSEDGE